MENNLGITTEYLNMSRTNNLDGHQEESKAINPFLNESHVVKENLYTYMESNDIVMTDNLTENPIYKVNPSPLPPQLTQPPHGNGNGNGNGTCCRNTPWWSRAIIVMIGMILLIGMIAFIWFITQPPSGPTTDANGQGGLSDITSTTTPIPKTVLTTIVATRKPLSLPPGVYEDCKDAKDKNELSEHIRISPDGDSSFPVTCNHETSGGGWTLFQRRYLGAVSFNHSWQEYRDGFGILQQEFWLGNEKLHRLTYQRDQALLVVLQGQGGEVAAYYGHITVSSEDRLYKLSLSDYVSQGASDTMLYNHNQYFSTSEQDHDSWGGGSCANLYSAGWWYNSCNHARLNGIWGRAVLWYNNTVDEFALYPTRTALMVRGR